MTDWREQPKKADSMLVPCWFHLDVYGYALKIIVGLHQIQLHSTQLTTTLKLTTLLFTLKGVYWSVLDKLFLM